METSEDQAEQWISSHDAREALGLKQYKFARLLGEAGIKRYKLAARDMRTWYIKAEDLDMLRKKMAQPRVASMSRNKAAS
jgi:hypothetical protein